MYSQNSGNRPVQPVHYFPPFFFLFSVVTAFVVAYLPVPYLTFATAGRRLAFGGSCVAGLGLTVLEDWRWLDAGQTGELSRLAKQGILEREKMKDTADSEAGTRQCRFRTMCDDRP